MLCTIYNPPILVQGDNKQNQYITWIKVFHINCAKTQNQISRLPDPYLNNSGSCVIEITHEYSFFFLVGCFGRGQRLSTKGRDAYPRCAGLFYLFVLSLFLKKQIDPNLTLTSFLCLGLRLEPGFPGYQIDTLIASLSTRRII